MVRPSSRRLGIVLALTASVGLLSACGSSSSKSVSSGEAGKTGLQVAKDAAAALRSSGAVHISGSLPGAAAGTPESVDMQLQTDGSQGMFTASRTHVSLSRVKGITYVKAPAAYYATQGITPANAAKVANRWLRLPAGSSLDKAFVFSDVVNSITSQKASTIIDKVTTGHFEGKNVIVVSATDGSKLFVAESGPPFPLGQTGPTGTGSMATLSGFGDHAMLTPPSGAVDPRKLIPS